ncbi:MAG: amidohydrolase family protein [Anaerolineales bacterium]|nr:amidohydrolase family protein [Anaerolineales bacterium]
MLTLISYCESVKNICEQIPFTVRSISSYTRRMLKLPGLIDPHVHVREPGATHKEDWDTVTQAALAGGVTTLLAMPNTKPPIFDEATLTLALDAAKAKARCDYGQYIGAGPDNADIAAALAPKAAGLKMYLDSTFGELRLDDMTLWMPHFQTFPKSAPMVMHAESRTLAATILFPQSTTIPFILHMFL